MEILKQKSIVSGKKNNYLASNQPWFEFWLCPSLHDPGKLLSLCLSFFLSRMGILMIAVYTFCGIFQAHHDSSFLGTALWSLSAPRLAQHSFSQSGWAGGGDLSHASFPLGRSKIRPFHGGRTLPCWFKHHCQLGPGENMKHDSSTECTQNAFFPASSLFLVTPLHPHSGVLWYSSFMLLQLNFSVLAHMNLDQTGRIVLRTCIQIPIPNLLAK